MRAQDFGLRIGMIDSTVVELEVRTTMWALQVRVADKTLGTEDPSILASLPIGWQSFEVVASGERLLITY
jgi:hypothetical protein